MTTNDDLKKAMEGLMPSIEQIIKGVHKVTVERIDSNSARFVTQEGAPFELTDAMIEQLKIFINITSLYGQKGSNA